MAGSECLRVAMEYDPEMDVCPEFHPKAPLYSQCIRVPTWRMVKLEKIDTITELSLMSSHLAMPREEHQEAARHIMA